MPHISGPDWYARELAELQDEIARLYRLLGVITPIYEHHEDTQGHSVVPPTASRPTPRARRSTGGSSHPILRTTIA